MGDNEEKLPPTARVPVRDVISLVVTGLVIVGFAADIFIPNYDIPAPLWVAFMTILGYFFADKFKNNGKTS